MCVGVCVCVYVCVQVCVCSHLQTWTLSPRLCSKKSYTAKRGRPWLEDNGRGRFSMYFCIYWGRITYRRCNTRSTIKQLTVRTVHVWIAECLCLWVLSCRCAPKNKVELCFSPFPPPCNKFLYPTHNSIQMELIYHME